MNHRNLYLFTGMEVLDIGSDGMKTDEYQYLFNTIWNLLSNDFKMLRKPDEYDLSIGHSITTEENTKRTARMGMEIKKHLLSNSLFTYGISDYTCCRNLWTETIWQRF